MPPIVPGAPWAQGVYGLPRINRGVIPQLRGVSGGSSTTLTLPVLPRTGDLLVIAYGHNAANAGVTCSGGGVAAFTKVNRTSVGAGNQFECDLFIGIVGASPSTAISFSVGGANTNSLGWVIGGSWEGRALASSAQAAAGAHPGIGSSGAFHLNDGLMLLVFVSAARAAATNAALPTNLGQWTQIATRSTDTFLRSGIGFYRPGVYATPSFGSTGGNQGQVVAIVR